METKINEFIKRQSLKINNEKNFTNEDLGDIATIYAKDNDLLNYISKINLGNRVKYDINTDELYLATDRCDALEIAKQNYSKKGFNQLLLFSVFHELRHVEQSKILFENYKNYDSKFIKMLLYNELFRTFGLQTNKSFIEYDANINALYNLTKIFKEMNIEFDSRLLEHQIKKILLAYEDKPNVLNSNLCQINNRYWETFLNDNINFIKHDFTKCIDAYKYANNNTTIKNSRGSQRLLKGDTLTELEILTLKKIQTGKIKTNDIFVTIDELNEKVKSPFTDPDFKAGDIRELFGRKR